ncbi:carbohydrate binding domain-containing protein [Longispora sp. NPDC051575]|uniref:carbohydrate binding domain-containing protein n=1 Tax=Longispora sp. NPDC051575 TaxID=3154943 RepID=UPI0034331561
MRPLLAVLALTTTLLTPAAAQAAAPATYHLDCSATAAGDGSAASPWRDLATVNARTFAPGDTLVLRRGVTCTGQLHPLGSGTAAAPITVAAYGTGTARPVVAAAGTAYAAFYLRNQQYWEIRDLELTNDAPTAAERNGLLVELTDYGTGHHYVVDDVYVHHVRGNDDKASNGIQFRVTGTTTPTNFDDVLVQNSEIFHVDREGLTTRSTWMCRPTYGTGDGCGTKQNWVANTRVVFQDNVLHDIGGDGVVLRVSDHGLVQRNLAYDIAMRSPGNNAGLWTINSDYPTFQFNEVHHVRRQPGTNDGTAFDSDYGNLNALFQYNYSHDNEGGFMLFCGACGAGSSSTGTVVRYNLSVADKSRILYAVGEKNAQIHNNTFLLPAGSSTAIVQDSGNTKVAFTNNIVSNLGSGGYGSSASSAYTWKSTVFSGNHPASEPADATKITADPKLVAPGTGPDGLKLGTGSPARGAGTVVAGNGGRDYFGGAVPTDCRPDIGAHQASPTTCANLLANGGFEAGTLAPWTVYNRGQLDPAAHSGTSGARVGAYPGSVEQVVTVQPNRTYTLAGWGKVSATGTQVVIGVKSYGGTETRAPAFTTTSWASGGVAFSTGATNTTAVVYCYARVGTGYGYCDDLTLVAT